MPQEPDDDEEVTKRSPIDSLLVDLENIEPQENEGFQACVLHHSRLQSLLGVWLHATQAGSAAIDDPEPEHSLLSTAASKRKIF